MSTRGRGEPLNQQEIDGLRDDLRAGYTNDYCAEKYNCSTRNVQKYRRRWFGNGDTSHSHHRARRLDNGQRHYARYANTPPPPPAKPNMLPWMTVEMLTGARAPVAKVRS